MNKGIVEQARCLRWNIGLPKSFWVKAVKMAYYVINRSPRAALDEKVAEEVWTDNEVYYSILRTFGCLTYVRYLVIRDPKLIQNQESVLSWLCERSKMVQILGSRCKKMGIVRDAVFDDAFMLKFF